MLKIQKLAYVVELVVPATREAETGECMNQEAELAGAKIKLLHFSLRIE